MFLIWRFSNSSFPNATSLNSSDKLYIEIFPSMMFFCKNFMLFVRSTFDGKYRTSAEPLVDSLFSVSISLICSHLRFLQAYLKMQHQTVAWVEVFERIFKEKGLVVQLPTGTSVNLSSKIFFTWFFYLQINFLDVLASSH